MFLMFLISKISFIYNELLTFLIFNMFAAFWISKDMFIIFLIYYSVYIILRIYNADIIYSMFIIYKTERGWEKGERSC